MKIQLLDKAKKKKIVEGIQRFGVTKIPQLLIKTGKERIRAYSGNFSKEEIMDIWKILPVEGIGLYVGKELINRHGVREIRLSLDGLHVWKSQITSHIVQLSKAQEEEWFNGRTIELENEEEAGYVAVLSGDGEDFLGMGKIGEDKKTLYNFLPKERRRKTSTL